MSVNRTRPGATAGHGERAAEPIKLSFGRYGYWIRRGSMAVILLAILAILWSLPTRQLADGLLAWSEGLGPWSFVVFLGAYILLTIFALPVWPLPFIAGALFGMLWGSVTASLSCATAAGVTFLIARVIGRTTLREQLEASPRMRALEKMVEKGDWKIVVAVRLSRFLPFGMQNYAFGLTGIGFRTFLIVTWAVALPGIILQAYMGDLGFTSMEAWQERSAPDWQTWAMQIAGLVALLAAVGYIAYLGKTVYSRAVKEQLEKQLQAETSGRETSLPLVTLILLAVACVSLGAAIWSVAERDALRNFVEQRLSS